MKAPIIALLAALSIVPLVAQKATFSTGVEAVRVDVLVTQNGQPVNGLQASDFEVRDNGVVQQVDLVRLEQLPLTVVLALDMSDSVAGERLWRLRDAGGALLDKLKKDDQAALVTFSHQVARSAPLTTDIPQVREALSKVVGRGDTALADGVYAAMTIAQAVPGRSLLIVFSDGLDTASFLTPDSVVAAARQSDVVVYSVAIGDDRDLFLSRLSDMTGGRSFALRSEAELDAAFVRVLDEFRNRYLVSYSPQGVAPGGWHRLDVRVKRGGVRVNARPGYMRQ